MIDYINTTRSCHIVTIEDPIEYFIKDKKAIVSQREIGIDVDNYEDALTYLMREDPDVVFIGEVRDARTVAAGMRASETGHLVFGTIHAIKRIPDRAATRGPVPAGRTRPGQTDVKHDPAGNHQPGTAALRQERRGPNPGRRNTHRQSRGEKTHKRRQGIRYYKPNPRLRRRWNADPCG